MLTVNRLGWPKCNQSFISGGRSSVDVMKGNVSHNAISFQVRWRNQRTAERYKKAPLVAQSPDQIYNSRPECRREFSKKHIRWLAQVTVMTYGEKSQHPFTKALMKWAPSFVTECNKDLPESYPHPRAIQAMKSRLDSVTSGLIIK